MVHHKLVLPEFLNFHGFLYGGYLLQWIDEMAYMTVATEFPGHEFVTVAMDNVEFRHTVENGEVLRFEVNRTRLGVTSVHYHVQVFGSVRSENPDEVVFETGISFVSIDADGNKKAIRA